MLLVLCGYRWSGCSDNVLCATLTPHAATAAFSPLPISYWRKEHRGKRPPPPGSDVEMFYWWLLVFVQAMAYFEQLKESQDAWEACAEALAKGIYR